MSFFGISAFAQVMRELRISHDPCPALQHADVGDGNPATFTVPEFPHIKLTFEELMAPFGDPSSVAPMMELDGKLGKAIEGKPWPDRQHLPRPGDAVHGVLEQPL